jgi:hypothetical protein
MSLESSIQELLRGCPIAPLAEPESNRAAVAIDCSIQIPPPAANFDICLIDIPPVGDRALAPIELLQQERGIVDGPAMNGRVIDRNAALATISSRLRRLRL